MHSRVFGRRKVSVETQHCVAHTVQRLRTVHGFVRKDDAVEVRNVIFIDVITLRHQSVQSRHDSVELCRILEQVNRGNVVEEKNLDD